MAAELSAVSSVLLPCRCSSVLPPMVLPSHLPSPAGFYNFKPLEFHSFASRFKGQIVFVFVIVLVCLVFQTRSLEAYVGLELTT